VAATLAAVIFWNYQTQSSPYRIVQVPEDIAPPSKAVLFFWYGCPHCRHAEEVFRKDSADEKISALIGGQHIQLIPVPINKTWEMHARLFYALDHLHVSADTHWFVMNTIQDKDLYTSDKLLEGLPEIAAYASKNNVGAPITAQKLAADMSSEQTNKEILKARLLVKAINLNGVPAMLINKTHLIELGEAAGYEDLLPNALKLLSEKK
jgi:protein-disulfide isomerase